MDYCLGPSNVGRRDRFRGCCELYGLAPVETRTCEGPAIASNVAPLPGIVAEGRTEYLMPANGSSRVSEAVVETLCSQHRWAAFSSSARRYADERVSWGAVTDSFYSAYRGDCGSSSRSSLS